MLLWLRVLLSIAYSLFYHDPSICYVIVHFSFAGKTYCRDIALQYVHSNSLRLHEKVSQGSWIWPKGTNTWFQLIEFYFIFIKFYSDRKIIFCLQYRAVGASFLFHHRALFGWVQDAQILPFVTGCCSNIYRTMRPQRAGGMDKNLRIAHCLFKEPATVSSTLQTPLITFESLVVRLKCLFMTVNALCWWWISTSRLQLENSLEYIGNTVLLSMDVQQEQKLLFFYWELILSVLIKEVLLNDF